jgi:hypothetical protein
MDGYQLTAIIFQSIAKLGWPVAVCVIIWMFKNKLLELLPGVRVKHKDWEASFRLEKAEEAVASKALALPGKETVLSPEEEDRFSDVVKASPRAAILETGATLEETLRRFARAHGILRDKGRTPSSYYIVRELENRGMLDAGAAKVLNDLRAVGNSAAHGGEEFSVTEKDAYRFRALADFVTRALEEWGEGDKGTPE